LYYKCNVEASNQVVWGLISLGHGWILKNLLLDVFQGVIDATYIHLQKPQGENFVVVNYYSFKQNSTSSKCKQ
jgi:hypothetical protein